MNKLKKGELKGNIDHFHLLWKIVREVEKHRGELVSRESIPAKWWYGFVFWKDWININAVYKIKCTHPIKLRSPSSNLINTPTPSISSFPPYAKIVPFVMNKLPHRLLSLNNSLNFSPKKSSVKELNLSIWIPLHQGPFKNVKGMPH